MKAESRSLLYGTVVMTVANFIVRISGFVYRVLLSRLIGPQGMGLIQLVYPLFFTAIALTSSGLPIAVSRLVAEKSARGDAGGVRRTVSTALRLSAAVSLTVSAILLLAINPVSEHIIKDLRARGAMIALLPSLVIISLVVVLKGYFYGIKSVRPPALAEILEQFVRMGVSLALLYWAAPRFNLAVTAALVMLGTVMGDLASLAYLHYSYGISGTKVKDTVLPKQGRILRDLIAIALPITGTRLISSVLQSVNSVIIPQRLGAGGMPVDEAIGLFGIMTGMVMPLLFMPFVVTNALQVNIIPNLSENVATENIRGLQDKTDKALLITTFTAFPSVALLISLGRPIGDLLYGQPMVGELIVPVSLGLVVHALQHTSSGILNGLGKQNRAAIHFIIGSVVQLICSYFLIARPGIGIYGYIAGFFASSIVVCILNLSTALDAIKLPFNTVDWLLKPGFSAFLMTSVTSAAYKFCQAQGLPLYLSLAASFVPGIASYILSLFALKGIPPALLARFKKAGTRPGI